MNSRETLTCNLFHLPQDIFRVIFQYLSVYDLMEGEKAFLKNQELLSLYRSSLAGFTLKDKITNEFDKDKLISWITTRKLLVEDLKLYSLRKRVMDFLDHSRSSLKTIYFSTNYSDSYNFVPVKSPLGHFPSVTSVTYYNSHYITNDQLLLFFSHSPQLESVKFEAMRDLSNEIIPHLSNSCPKIKILSLLDNEWVNDETITLLTQHRLPQLKSLNIRDTNVTNEESLRQFILSHPLLCCLFLPHEIQYSMDFLIFYLRQVIFPPILSRNNYNDLESHSLAISSLCYCVREGILDERYDVVTPELFSVDILSHIYHKDGSLNTLYDATQVFYNLSKFPSMIDSILQSQFIPFILNDTNPDNYVFPDHLLDLLINCGVFHDYFPLLVEIYRTHPSSLIWIFRRAVEDYFSLLTAEELQTMIPIVLKKLQNEDYTDICLMIISKLLQDPSSQLLIDPNTLLSSMNISNCNIGVVVQCLKIFISINENYQQLLIESNLLPQIMTVVDPYDLIDFVDNCLLSSRDGLLVDHLVDSRAFQKLLSYYSEFSASMKKKMESIFKRLIKFKDNKYSEIVKEMDLPKKFRTMLFRK